MHGLSRLHIARWEVRPRTPPLPVFAYGPGRDADPPSARPCGRKVGGIKPVTRHVCAAVTAFASMLEALEIPRSRSEVAEETGCNGTTVSETMQALHMLGLSHIAVWVWRDHGGAPIEHHQLGPGPDAPKPRMTKAVRRDLRQRRLAASREVRKTMPLLDWARAVAGNDAAAREAA